MNTAPQKILPVLIAGLTAFTILTFFSIYFLWERVLFLDFSFYMFDVVRSNHFYHPGYRFIGLVNQIPSLLAIYFQLPLKTVLALHSLSFPLFQASCFFLILFYFKNIPLALSHLLFNILLTADAYYWCEAEFPQGVSTAFVFMALLHRKNLSNLSKSLSIIIGIALMVTALWAHPLVFLPYGFMLLYLSANKNFSVSTFLKWGTFLLLMIVLRFIVAKNNWYESSKIGGGLNGLKLLPQFFSLPILKNSAMWFLKDYFIFVILFIVTLFYYIKNRAWLKFSIVLLYVIGYYIVVSISNPDTDKFYVENLWIPMSIGVAMPFAFEIFPLLKNLQLQIAALLIIVAIRIVIIYNAHEHFTERVNWWNKTIAIARTSANQKFIIPKDEAPMELLHHTFSTVNESILFTASESPERVLAITVLPEIDKFRDNMENEELIITECGSIHYDDINSNYFKFKKGKTVMLHLK